MRNAFSLLFRRVGTIQASVDRVKCLAFLLLLTLNWGRLYAQGNPKLDTLFTKPYTDLDEWRDQPVRHRYVHGGFKGTDAKFSIYFPPKEKFQGRFFQHITPVPLSENLAQQDTADHQIAFSIASGGYFIQTNEGGKTADKSPAIAGYLTNAAVAKYSRVLAGQMYGPQRVYGYCYGGSGGAFKTIGGIENTTGVWDGSVPFVIGTPMALPNVFTVQTHAQRILHDKLPAIADAVDVGGSGDPYAGLNEEERAALLEVTRMGFPLRTWYSYQTLGMGALAVLIDVVGLADRQYFTDFWKVPGYLGANPPASLLKARIRQKTVVTKMLMLDDAIKLGLRPPTQVGAPAFKGGVDEAWKSLQGQVAAGVPVALQLQNMPAGNLEGAKLILKTGAAKGQMVNLATVVGNAGTITPGLFGDLTKLLTTIKAGDSLEVDNSIFLAVQTYHRHQVPPSKDYHVWDQFRGPDGKPLYPQRPMLLGPLIAANGSGGTPQTGKISGKMIVLESLMDEAAFPWQADWYRNKIKEHLGASLDDNFRLYFTDHALHTEAANARDRTHIVGYGGELEQALRDLSAWVEKGVSPPANTTYKVVDGQVEVPATAAERKGLQPVVTLQANGSKRAEVRAGQKVTFIAAVEVPPAGGQVIGAEWDFEGEGTFLVAGKLQKSKGVGAPTNVKTTYSFPKPGTYFVTLRATSQRPEAANTRFGRIQNLDRVRVVVK